MSATTLAILKTEVLTDPLARGYAGLSDADVASDMNIKNRPGNSTVEQLRTYFLLERKAGMFLYGRLHIVATSAVGDDPIEEAAVLTLEHITSAATMCNILNPTSGFELDLADSRFDAMLNDLAGGQGAKVLGAGDKTAIQGLSLNSTSRGRELNIGKVKASNVQFVRS